MDGAALAILMIATLSGVAVVSSHQVCYSGLKYDLMSNNPHRWVLPHEDPCEYAAVLSRMTTKNKSYQQGAPYYLDKIAIRLLEFFGCQGDKTGIECSDPEPLRLEDGIILDESISASSRFDARRGRLNGEPWVPSYNDSNPWLEVDLGEDTVVSGVITQGFYMTRRVTQFKMKYKKLSSSEYDVVGCNGAIQVLDGGNIENDTTPVTNMFYQSIVATIVRIEPVTFATPVALRLELLGCHIN